MKVPVHSDTPMCQVTTPHTVGTGSRVVFEGGKDPGVKILPPDVLMYCRRANQFKDYCEGPSSF